MEAKNLLQLGYVKNCSGPFAVIEANRIAVSEIGEKVFTNEAKTKVKAIVKAGMINIHLPNLNGTNAQIITIGSLALKELVAEIERIESQPCDDIDYTTFED